MVGSLTKKEEGWKATAKTALNDCKIQSTWTLEFEKSGDGSALKYTAAINAATGGADADCKSLSPNFANIAHN